MINHIFEILVKHNIIDIQSVLTLLVTFSKIVLSRCIYVPKLKSDFLDVKGTANFTASSGSKPVTRDTIWTSVTISGEPIAREKFYQELVSIIKHNQPRTPDILTKLIVELLLDNHIVKVEEVTKEATKQNIDVTITTVPAKKPKTVFELITLTYITIVKSSPDTLGPLINKLLELLTIFNIIDISDARRILVTISELFHQREYQLNSNLLRIF